MTARAWHAIGFVAGMALAPAAWASGVADCPSVRDALASDDPLAAPIRPATCAVVTQTPPDFTWPAYEPPQPPAPKPGADAVEAPKPKPEPKRAYAVTLHHPGGRTETVSTPHNWLAWKGPLAAGDYRWMVTLPDGRRSEPRRFTIAPDAVPFVIPAPEAIVDHARQRPHPRSWAQGEASPVRAMRRERSGAFAKLVAEMESKMTTPVQPEPVATSINANYDDAVAEHKRTLNSALAYAVTKSDAHGADAARRLMAQARWSTTGPLSFEANDMGSRTVAWTLALGYDWAYDFLSPGERKAILEAIAARTRVMYERYVSSEEITRHPYDSHGNLTLTITAAISALIAGDWPEADEWLRRTAPAAAVWTSPWGGSDGGFANGTMQGLWDAASNLLAWYVLEGATGIDLSRKEWVRNHARYLAYFGPPGAPFELFGDGQEMDGREFRARVVKALALYSPTRIGRWHAGRVKGEMEERVELLLAPRRPAGARSTPASPGAPHAAHFPSIGWVAMHSDLADPKRTSVYFRSSPYGAHNHGHADQNGFVIDHAGERLAIKSGYYDDYKTPHWREWYKHTRSANAITFDGGKGQGPDGIEFRGAITRFESDGKVDRAVGRAEAAYGGAVTKALREIVYARPGMVLVFDDLASREPRAWEWNLHALERMDPRPDGRVSVRRGRAAMCVEMLASPGVAFTQTDRFTVPPAGERPAQWHGTFAAKAPSRRAQFVALLRIGSACADDDPRATAERSASGWEVRVGETRLRLGGEGEARASSGS